MNAKSIYEVLATLGAGATMVAGCNTSPAPTGDSEVTLVPEVRPATSVLVNAATTEAPPPVNTAARTTGPSSAVAPSVAAVPTPLTHGRPAAMPKATTAPTTTEIAVSAPLPVATATLVQPVKPTPTPAATPTATHKHGADGKCGQGTCG